MFFLDQQEILLLVVADRDDESPADAELVVEERRNLRGGGGDDDPVKRSTIGTAKRAVLPRNASKNGAQCFEACRGVVTCVDVLREMIVYGA